MFSWATSHLEKLASTVAPQPTDPPGRFIYACKNGDEQGAISLLAELAGVEYSVDTQKGQTPLHFACLYSLTTLMEQILSMLLQRQIDGLSVMDVEGNTALHFASMSKKANALDMVKILVTKYGASVLAKNSQGQTAYDVASIPSLRQYLLPLQLQEETRIALNNGGVGLIPGMDLGGLKVANSHLPPPPTIPGSFPPHEQQFASPTGITQQHSQGPDFTPTDTATSFSSQYLPPPPVMTSIASSTSPDSGAPPSGSSAGSVPAPPSSANRDYSLRGYSSAALEIKTSDGRRVLKPDGFHSSSSDKRLQQKYGHQSGNRFANLPPPPRSGEQVTPPVTSPASGGLSGAPLSANSNPFAGGRQQLVGVRPSTRYVAVDHVTGQAQPAPPAVSGHPTPYTTPVAASYPVPSFTTFQTSQLAGNQQPVNASVPMVPQPAPIAPVTSSPAFPPPPQLTQVSNSPATAAGLFATPSPVRRLGEADQDFSSLQQRMDQTPSATLTTPGAYKISPAPKSGESPFLTASPTRASKMFSAPPENLQTLAPAIETPQETQQTVTTVKAEATPATSVDDAAAMFASAATLCDSSTVPTAAESSSVVTSHLEGTSTSKGSPFAQALRDSSTASDLFASPPSNMAEESLQIETMTATKGEQPQASPQATEEDEVLDEIPLSPTKTSTMQPENGKDGLYQAIGMPPPPFLRK
ncbi:hypothetical protein FisN_3Lh170 [Fistulifera solaris]|uniref:Uncharacterized protein n=1 Tax=Fistulifera solaris TaxID=1519565 RepID=A0A1Z5JPH3_FISSO|nr:hypothetical protein FisN_3Lh170 [Fistulifera solaris]|eukprot:GAX15732.1 hypothetical protein FisN_3Lh170 [Fistulifera solaris]